MLSRFKSPLTNNNNKDFAIAVVVAALYLFSFSLNALTATTQQRKTQYRRNVEAREPSKKLRPLYCTTLNSGAAHNASANQHTNTNFIGYLSERADGQVLRAPFLLLLNILLCCAVLFCTLLCCVAQLALSCVLPIYLAS